MKITRKTDLGALKFDDLIGDFIEHSQDDHRRGSSFFRKSIIFLDAEFYPELDPSFYGYWETNTYIADDNYGYEPSEINELTQVELQERTVVIKEWVPCI